MEYTFTQQLVNICEIIGIIAFAISGAMVAIEKDLDIFGVVVLGVTTALGGGVIRDLILAINPPTMFISSNYAALAAISSLVIFIFSYFNYKYIQKNRKVFENALNFFDSIGLGVFVVLGVNTAMYSGYSDNNFLIMFIGVITGIGGGILRDIMVKDIPFILRKRIYALAAILGGGVYIVLLKNGINSNFSLIIGIFITILIRVLSKKYEWSLPRVKK
ncbi:trimeric intracellular cation channel family protein [Anaerofustis sp. NSJ-163]|uniref:trimeric intracellular cation channel family protein n=1 Tax=Anaerofustis sp. NSJ-163 TaxID=2944391 RepID=UPI00209C09BC|nr:trimeric intracellular cation channel family protein [Anaerofustis sp. NSJ-163]MCO8193459.1 trimeric intracellular cation channel family protein [Anaerofustis sp. NSJ-163]